jgi:PAS domain S-box-containing protein
MKASVENKIALGITLSLLVLVGIGLLSYRTTTNLVATQTWVAHSYEVIATLESGLAILTDAETDQRAYLLTGDDRFLEDSRNSQGQIAGWIRKIRALTADNPQQQRRLDKLEPLIVQRLVTLNDRIRLRQQQGLQAATDAVSLRIGKNLMNQIWQGITEMRDVENGLLVDRQQAARESARKNTLVVVVSSVVACAAGLLVFFIIQHDLRQRYKMEMELKKNEALMESILDNTPAIIFLKDLAGRYLFVNRRFMDVVGLSRDQIKGKTAFDVTKKNLAEAADEHYRKVLATGQPVEFEETVLYPDGPRQHRAMKFPLRNAAGEIYAMAGISTDITERRRFEQLLRESEERLRLLVENIKDYSLIMLDVTGHVVSWNTGAQQLKGYTAEEIIGQHFSCFYPEEFIRAGFPGQQLALAAKEGRAVHEGWRRRKDGTQFWASVVITPIRHASGELLGFAKVTGDLTSRKMSEQMLQQLNESLRHQAGALEAANHELEAFSYSVSHDLRSPLRHIDGFVDLLKKQSVEKLDDRGRRYLNIIADSARQMGCLIDDLLVFSRMGRTEMHHSLVVSNSLLDEVLNTVKNDANDRNINWQISPLPDIEADFPMMRQVWLNLVGNAVKYTRTRDPAVIEIGCQNQKEDEIIFFVRDNGVGFDMQYAHKLFGVFQRLHRTEEFEGTGIGLANVRRIVTRHGGRTWAEGEMNVGAAFYFSLPKRNHKTQG